MRLAALLVVTLGLTAPLRAQSEPDLFRVGPKEQFHTIQAAIDAMEQSTRIEVAAGTYAEALVIQDVPLFSSFGKLEIVGKGKVIIAPPAGPAVSRLGGKPYTLRLEKLILQGGNPHGIFLTGECNLVLDRCRVLDSAGDAVHTEDTAGNINVTLLNCRVEGAGGNGITVQGATDAKEELFENSGTFAVKTSFRDVAGAAVSSDVLVLGIERCQVRDGGQGFLITSRSLYVERNTLRNLQGDGILVTRDPFGSAATVERNTIHTVGGHGLVLDGSAFDLCEKNKVTLAGGDGLRLLGDGACPVTNNKVSKVLGTGVLVASDGNTLTKNRVSKATDFGFRLTGTDNTLVGNKAAKTAPGFGVSDSDGGNTYGEKNAFDSVDPDNTP